MTMTLLLNKRLRNNYNKVLKLNNAEEIKQILSSLTETEKRELFAYTYGYAIKERMKEGIPVSEYFLLHYDEFIPGIDGKTYEKADKHLNIIFTVAAIVTAIVLFVNLN